MDVDKMTLNDMRYVKQQAQAIDEAMGKASAILSAVDSPYKVGEQYLIRTVTFYYVGKLVELFAGELVLDEASWIPDTGRYSDCLKIGAFAEVEPITTGPVIVPRGSIVDVVGWPHKLPKDVK